MTRPLADVIRQVESHLYEAQSEVEVLALLMQVTEASIRDYLRDDQALEVYYAFIEKLLDRLSILIPQREEVLISK